MRSKLFVPGSRPEFFGKALASEADALSIDLEDSVVDNRKAEARAIVTDFLQSAQALATDKLIIVRCNGLDTAHFEPDLRAITQPTLGMINLPKVESASDINAVVKMLELVEMANSIVDPVTILASIESPKGLRLAAEIAAHPRVVGLQLALNDLFDAMVIDRRDSASVHTAMFTLQMAAGEAGVFAYDGAFPDIEDSAGYCAEAKMAHRLGYLGKSCIHPKQIVLANNEFIPGDEEVDFARRVIKGFRDAKDKGLGAFVLDGKMITFLRLSVHG